MTNTNDLILTWASRLTVEEIFLENCVFVRLCGLLQRCHSWVRSGRLDVTPEHTIVIHFTFDTLVMLSI